jgi:hypothetical protein
MSDDGDVANWPRGDDLLDPVYGVCDGCAAECDDLEDGVCQNCWDEAGDDGFEPASAFLDDDDFGQVDDYGDDPDGDGWADIEDGDDSGEIEF